MGSRKSGREFRRSPLSLAVPLDGTDTVVGAKTLEKLQLRDRILSNQQAGILSNTTATKPPAPAPRYTGPYIKDLTVEDVKQEPKPWSLFFLNGERGSLREAYSMPQCLVVLQDRIEENMYYYFANYLRILLFGLLITFYVWPKALIAVALGGFTAYLNLLNIGGSANRFEAVLSHLVPFFAIGTMFVASLTNCWSALLRCVVYCATLIWLHAAVRRGESEYRRKRSTASGRLSFLFRRQGTLEQQDEKVEIFQEVYDIARRAGAEALATVIVNTQYYWYIFWDYVRRKSLWR